MWKWLALAWGLFYVTDKYGTNPADVPKKDKPMSDAEFKAIQEKAIADENERRAKKGLPPLGTDVVDEIQWEEDPDIFEGFDPDTGEPIWTPAEIPSHQ